MSKQFQFLKWHGKKAIALLVVTVLLSFALVEAMIAFVVVSTDRLTNEFLPATLSIERSADGKGVINDGDVSVYVRAAVVVTWAKTSEDGSILATAPKEGMDYTYACADGWVKASDGFWYYTKPIAPDAQTTVDVLTSVEQLGEAPDGYELSVELALDAIQSTPTDAVTESFRSGVSSVATDGTLTLK